MCRSATPAAAATPRKSRETVLLGGGKDKIEEGQQLALAMRQRQVKECGPNPWLRRTAQMRCSSAAAVRRGLERSRAAVPEPGRALQRVTVAGFGERFEEGRGAGAMLRAYANA